jgi:hypothetical protein
VTFGHRTFVFNEHLDANGAVDPTKVRNTVVIDQRQTPVQFLDMRDPYHIAQGGALGRVHKGFLELRLSGRIEVPDASQAASLADKEFEMRAAFDPYLCLLDSPYTQGAYPLNFFEPTTDLTNYPTGWVALRYYMRPTRQPVFTENVNERGSRPYSVFLVAADPRCYEQTAQTLVLIPGTPSGSIVNRGNVPAPLYIQIVMSGPGASNFSIARAGGYGNFVLDLTGLVNNDYVGVACETSAPWGEGRLVTVNGVRAAWRKVSGPGSWPEALPGSKGFAISNTTGVTSCTFTWYPTRA